MDESNDECPGREWETSEVIRIAEAAVTWAPDAETKRMAVRVLAQAHEAKLKEKD